MANLPNTIQKFKDLEKDFGTSNAEALWKRAIQLMTYVEKSNPVGMLMFIHATQSNIPSLPDSQYWQLCDGSVVSNANSPMNGVTLPDLRDKFVRHPSSGEIQLSSGGQDIQSLQHNHGGFTGFTNPQEFLQMDNGGDRVETSNHRHTIGNDLGNVTTVPTYLALKVYVRIV